MDSTTVVEDESEVTSRVEEPTELENLVAGATQLPEEAKEVVERAKAAGKRPYWVVINGITFVYRPVTRREWRNLMREQNEALSKTIDDPVGQLEVKNDYTELTVKTCMIWSEVPIDDDLGAGYVDSLCEAVLVDSGFGPPDGPSAEV